MNVFHSIRKNRRGFSLVEALLVVAILTILMGLAIPNAIGYSRQLKITSLDDSAHSIFMTAQNKLMSLKNAGEDLSALFDLKDGDKVTENKGKSVAAGEYYAVAEEAKLSALIPDLSIDETLKNSNYVVEIEPRTGAVYAVWFWEKGQTFDYKKQAYSEASPDRSQRLRSNLMVGYYGGSAISRPEIRQTPMPKVEVINAEELLLSISVPRDGVALEKKVSATVTLTGKNGKRYEILSSAALHYAGADDAYKASLALDSLTPDSDWVPNFEGKEKRARQFKDWANGTGEWDPSSFIEPGDDFDVEVRVCVDGGDFLPQYVYYSEVNSLFASVEGETAQIAYGRHLQNLHPEISKVSSSVRRAVQIRSIRFAEKSASSAVYSWEDTYGQKKLPFVPIENAQLTSYDGRKYLLEGLYAVGETEYTDAGLFERVKGELKDIYLVDATVKGNGNVGALAGTVSSVNVSGCRVYLTSAEATSPSLTGTTVGGLVGKGGEADGSVNIGASFACAVESGITVGGLVGKGSGDVKITNSYAAGYLVGNTAGGLIGEFSAAGSAEAIGSYAAGVIAHAERAGGLVADGKPTVSDCYAAVRYSREMVEKTLKDEVTIYGTFEGDGETKYVSQMGLKYFGGGKPVTSFELYVTGGYLAKENEKGATSAYKLLPETVHEYGLSEQYPYKMIVAGGSALPHYGDWLEETEAYLVYYEKYDDDTYGLYASHERLKVNTLKMSNFDDDLHKRFYVVDDGYALFVLSTPDTINLSLYVTIGGEEKELRRDEFENVDFCGEKVKCTMYLIQEPTITIKGDWTEYDGTGLLTQPLKHYYTTVEYKIAYTDGYGTTYNNPYSLKTYYFNPHFACEVFETEPDKTAYSTEGKPIYLPQKKAGAEGAVSTAVEGSEPSAKLEYTASAGEIVIRSARQLSNIHCYTNTASGVGGLFGIAGVQGSKLHQLFDIDFIKYTENRLSGGGKDNDRIFPATLYKGLYDGHNHVIRNIFLSRKAITDKKAIGLFAKVLSATLQNIFIVNPTAYVGSNDFGDYMGGLVGYCENVTIKNCGVYDEAEDQANEFETYKPYYRHKAVNSNDYTVVLGGLIGYAGSSTISESFAAVKIFGHTAGGFIGEMGDKTIVRDCYAGGYTKYADYYKKDGTVFGNVDGYPAYSEQSGTDTINVGGGGTSEDETTGKRYEGVIGGFVGIIDAGAKFEGICYTTCSVRGSEGKRIGLFAGASPDGYTTSATLYSVGVAITESASTKEIFEEHEYTFYQKQTDIRNESYLKKKGAFGSGLAHNAKKVYPYNAALKEQAYPYPSNLSRHYGDWV